MKRILLLLVFSGCCVTPEDEFIRNVYGSYNLLDIAEKIEISSTGDITRNGIVFCSLYIVFSSVSALYTVSDQRLGGGYIIVSFQENVLYLSNVFTDINQVHQVQLNAHATRI